MFQFNPGCCCDIETECFSRWGIYGTTYPVVGGLVNEALMYYSLNVKTGEEYYNAHEGRWMTKDSADLDVLVFWSFYNHRHSFGEDEFLTFLDRGKTIVICGEYIPPYDISDAEYVASLATALGAGDLQVHGDRLHMPYEEGHIWGDNENLSLNTNNLNKDLPTYSIKASSSVSGGIPIVTTYLGTFIVGKTVGNGKVLVSGDGNMTETGWTQLLKNICDNEFIPIQYLTDS